jgi:cytochrome d ubiquinol oxidase subunit II
VATCTALAACFLTVEMDRAGEWRLAGAFRTWALRATALMCVLAAAGAVLAGPLRAGLTGRGLPALVAGGGALAIALAALMKRFDRVARAAVAAATAALVWGWGLAQYPRLACSRVTVAGPVALLAGVLRAAAYATSVAGAWLAVSPWALGYASAGAAAWAVDLAGGLALVALARLAARHRR